MERTELQELFLLEDLRQEVITVGKAIRRNNFLYMLSLIWELLLIIVCFL